MQCQIVREPTTGEALAYDKNGELSKFYLRLIDMLHSDDRFYEKAVNDPYVQHLMDTGVLVSASPDEVALGLWSKIYTKPIEEWFKTRPYTPIVGKFLENLRKRSAVADSFISAFEKAKIPIHVESLGFLKDRDKTSGTVTGTYNYVRRKLSLQYAPDASDEALVKVSFHELVHAVSGAYTEAYLKKYPEKNIGVHPYKIDEGNQVKLTDSQMNALDNLYEIYDSLIQKKMSGEIKGSYYGLRSFSEFIAEGFSDPRFQKLIASYPSKREKGKYRNLFEDVLDQILILLGIKDRTLLNDLFEYSSDAFIPEEGLDTYKVFAYDNGEPLLIGREEVLISNGEEAVTLTDKIEAESEFESKYDAVDYSDALSANDIIRGTDSVEEKRLKKRLFDVLNASGITMMSIDSYMRATGNTVSSGVDHLADTVNKIIAVSEDKLSSDSLSEEVGHMVMANFKDDPEYNRAMRLVEQTQEYKENASAYRTKYAEDNPQKSTAEIEEMVKEEILGQILGKNIIKKLRRNENKSLLTSLRRLFKKFLKLFQNDHLREVVATFSERVIDTPMEQIKSGKNIFYSISPQEKNKATLRDIIGSLQSRIISLRNRGLREEQRLVEAELAKLQNDLETAQIEQGLLRFMDTLKQSALNVSDYIEQVIAGKDVVNAQKLIDIRDYISHYKPFIEQIERARNFRGAFKHLTDAEFRSDMDSIIKGFNYIESFRNEYLEDANIDTLEQFFSNRLGIDRSDPEFEKKVEQKTQYSYKEEMRETSANPNWFEYWFGAAKYASDQLLRIVQDIISSVMFDVNRSTISFGKNLIDLVRKYGFEGKDMSWAFSKTNGKFDGRWKEPIKRAEWEESKRQHVESVEKKYASIIGLPELSKHYDVRKDQLENYKKGLYSKMQKEIADWFRKNTENIPEADKIYNDTYAEFKAGKMSRAAWVEFRENVIAYEVLKTGQPPIRVYKGMLSRPSMGGTKVLGARKIKTNDWTNPEYNDLTKEQKELLAELRKLKREIDEGLPGMTGVTETFPPQVSESFLDIYYRKNSKLFKNIGRAVKDELITKEEDAEYYGMMTRARPDGTKQKYVPTYFINQLGSDKLKFEDRLNETDRISTDIIGTLASYYKMAENFKQMTRIAPKLELLQEQAGSRKVKTRKGTMLGRDTYGFKQMDKLIEMTVYGMHRNRLEVNIPFLMDKAGQPLKLNVTKIVNRIQDYIRKVNLGGNLATMFSNEMQGISFSALETAVGEYVNPKSKTFASGVFIEETAKLLKEPLARNKGNKLYLLLEQIGVTHNVYESFRNLDKDRLTPKAINSGLYFGYEMSEYHIKGLSLIATLHNYREHEGRWYTKAQFDEAGIKGVDYYDLKSAWDRIEIKNNRVTSDIPDVQLSRILKRSRDIGDKIDGKLQPEDKAAAHQSLLWSMTTIHRGWLFSGLQRRFMSKGYNFTLDSMDVGYYAATANWMKDVFFGPERIKSLQELWYNWENLDLVTKSAVKRTMYEQVIVSISVGIAWLFYGAASGDHDDEYEWELASYLANRVLMENGAFGIVPIFPPMMATEMISTFRDPIVPMRQMELLFELHEILGGGSEVVEKGMWEGYTKRQRAIFRLTPVFKSVGLFRDPESTNEFLVNKPLKSIYKN